MTTIRVDQSPISLRVSDGNAFTAEGLALGALSGRNEQDIHPIHLTAGGQYDITTANSGEGFGWMGPGLNGVWTDLALYDAQGNLLLRRDVFDSQSSGYSADLLDYHAPYTGTYYIEVARDGSHGSGNYVLSVNVDSVPAPVTSTPSSSTGSTTTTPSTTSTTSSQRNVMAGTGGDDELTGTSGTDEISGRIGSDFISGMDGNDSLNGNQGMDFLNGNLGDDSVRGGKGDDRAHGGGDNDKVFGDLGEDSVYGDLGNDTLHGGRDNDVVYGGRGDDEVSGDIGDDTIYGDRGDDVLLGQSGADIFVFKAESGNDVLDDFNFDEGDLINLDEDLSYTLTADRSGNAVLDFGTGDSLTITDIGVADFRADWIALI